MKWKTDLRSLIKPVAEWKVNLKSSVRPKVFWGCIIAFLLGSSIILYTLKEKEEQLRIFTQQQLTETVEKKRVVTKMLIETTSAKKLVEEELKEREHQYELALARVEQEIAARHEVEARMVMALEENSVLQTRLKGYASLFKKGIYLGEIVVIKKAPRPYGKVLSVNKEYDFIVVNLGRIDNVKLGETLSIYRDDKFIGTARVEKIKEESCAASILGPWQSTEFKENDEIKI